MRSVSKDVSIKQSCFSFYKYCLAWVVCEMHVKFQYWGHELHIDLLGLKFATKVEFGLLLSI